MEATLIGDGTPDTPRQAAEQLGTYLAEAVAANRDRPGLLSQLTAAGLRDEEVIGFAMLMCLNMIDVWTSLSFVLLALASRPEFRGLLRREPNQVGPFVEEILRLEPPENGVVRMCTRDTVMGGVTIPGGSAVLVRSAAANREEGDDIAVADGRIVPHRHFTRGAGPHRCLGAGLVQAQLTVLIREWLRRIPDFEVAPGWPCGITPADIGAIARRGEGFRFHRLPLRWGHAGRHTGLCAEGFTLLSPTPTQVSG